MKKIYTILLLMVCFTCVKIKANVLPGDTGKTAGKVSHMHKSSGCGTVVIVEGTPQLVLIPKTKLPKEFDKEGLEILFTYRKLRMANPKGCNKGQPAELSGISIKK